MRNENIERFESLLLQTKREGMPRLIEWIRNSDFYKAPASTRFHSCHEGGLLEHSLNVFDCLDSKFRDPVYSKVFEEHGITRENAIISSLTHDICKANYYIAEPKNKKVYSEYGKKSDTLGRFDWQTVMGYTVDDQIPYGHGEKSVMMIETFIRLEPVERYAIRWHMGFTEPKEIWNTLSAAIRKYPLCLAIFEADLESTYLLEKEE